MAILAAPLFRAVLLSDRMRKAAESDMTKPEQTITLVVIDDDHQSLSLVSAALDQDGLQILTADDPEQGLEIVHQKHPHIVLLDLMMPKMSGMEVLERIVDEDPSTDVILMTAHYSTDRKSVV